MKKFIINSKQVKINCISSVKAILGTDNMEVIIQPHEDDQTDSQRGFFHVLCGIIAKDVGDSPEAIKHHIKVETFGIDSTTLFGKEIEYVKSSTKAKKNEYSELIESAYRIGAEFGIILPQPQYRG